MSVRSELEMRVLMGESVCIDNRVTSVLSNAGLVDMYSCAWSRTVKSINGARVSKDERTKKLSSIPLYRAI